jgi:chromosome partitioning protein
VKILSVFNQKGGVGKTTATINLGAAFALMLSYEAKPTVEPGRVLVVDLDQQAHSDITLSGGFFGKRASLPLGPYDNIAGLLLMETTRPILEIIARADIPLRARGNMDYIPSSKKKMMNVDAALRSDPVDGLFRLREILTPIESMYRYALIDNPPGLSHLSVNSLVAATHVLIPVQLEAPSLDGLAEAVQTIQSVQRQQNPALKIAGILPAMCDFRYQEQNEFLEGLKREYGELLLPPISRRAEITYAVSEGLDIFSFKPSRNSGEMTSASLSTQEFARAAEELRGRMER